MYGEERGINMCTSIRPEISAKNKYWISRHRYYELKHFCLQYPIWKKAYATLDELCISAANLEIVTAYSGFPGDPTAKCSIAKVYYSDRINMIEKAAVAADKELCAYILKAVTEDLSYTYLKTRLNIPCSKDTYYDRYRKFFWLLSKERE